MLIREDLGLLVLGAKEAIYALDLNDIRIENSAVRTLTSQQDSADTDFVIYYDVFLITCTLMTN